MNKPDGPLRGWKLTTPSLPSSYLYADLVQYMRLMELRLRTFLECIYRKLEGGMYYNEIKWVRDKHILISVSVCVSARACRYEYLSGGHMMTLCNVLWGSLHSLCGIYLFIGTHQVN